MAEPYHVTRAHREHCPYSLFTFMCFGLHSSTATWNLEPPSDSEGWRHVRLQQAGKNASGQTHYLSLSGFEMYGTVVRGVEEPLGKNSCMSL